MRRRNEKAKPSLGVDYQIESYLEYKGDQFSRQFDPNSLLYISKAMDSFDISSIAHSSDPTFPNFEESSTAMTEDPEYSHKHALLKAMARIRCPSLIIGVKSDALFPVSQQFEIQEILKSSGNENVVYHELSGNYGHDTFLVDFNNIDPILSSFFKREF